MSITNLNKEIENGYEFTGYNILNDTRNKEIYDSILPSCFEMKNTQITKNWLKTMNCSFKDDVYDCGGGLIIK